MKGKTETFIAKKPSHILRAMAVLMAAAALLLTAAALSGCRGGDAEEVAEKDNEQYVLVKVYSTIYGDRRLWNMYGYDEDGNKVEEMDYSTDSELGYRIWHTYKYDSRGNEIEDTFRREDRSSEKIRYEYEYDKRGNILQESAFYEDGSVYKTEYEYDGHGNMASETLYDDDGSLINDTEYDQRGNPVKVVYYGNISLYDYEYDEDGKVTKKIGDGYEVEYKYDDNGNLAMETEYSVYDGEREILSQDTYEYDENGNLSKKYLYVSMGGQFLPDDHHYEEEYVYMTLSEYLENYK